MKSEEFEYKEYDWEREYEVLAERAQEYAYQQLERDSQGIKAINYYRPALKYKITCNNKTGYSILPKREYVAASFL